MSFVKSIAVASVVVATLGFAGTANAEGARMSDCVKMASQVATAMDTAQPGDTADQARALAKNASKFCAMASYDRGVALYSKVLALLKA